MVCCCVNIVIPTPDSTIEKQKSLTMKLSRARERMVRVTIINYALVTFVQVSFQSGDDLFVYIILLPLLVFALPLSFTS